MLCAALLSLLPQPRLRPRAYVTVSDGDTITVRARRSHRKVRLVGIDSPELHDERQDYRDVGVRRQGLRAVAVGR